MKPIIISLVLVFLLIIYYSTCQGRRYPLYCYYHSNEPIEIEVERYFSQVGLAFRETVEFFNESIIGGMFDISGAGANPGFPNYKNEFLGCKTDTQLYQKYGVHWNGELSMTLILSYDECTTDILRPVFETDIILNGDKNWTTSQESAEGNPDEVYIYEI